MFLGWNPLHPSFFGLKSPVHPNQVPRFRGALGRGFITRLPQGVRQHRGRQMAEEITPVVRDHHGGQTGCVALVSHGIMGVIGNKL